MARVYRIARATAWSIKRQAAFGTALAKTDLTKFVKLADPLLIDESATHWNDRGMVGLGHEWETQRGKLSQMVRLEIPSQPLSTDIMSYLLAMGFSTVSTVDNTGSYTHTSKFTALSTTPSAYTFTLAIEEDGDDQYVQDLCVTNISLRGQGNARMEMGCSMVGTKIGGTLSSYTWPTAEDACYVYNNTGAFTSGTVLSGESVSQVRGFELNIDFGISMDLAFQKVAAEANRIYPAEWNYTPARNFTLTLDLLANTGDLQLFRAAQQAGTEDAITLSCVGAAIGASGESDTVLITIPKGIYTAVNEGYSEGLETISLTIDGHYDSDTGGPITIATTNDESSIGAAAT